MDLKYGSFRENILFKISKNIVEFSSDFSLGKNFVILKKKRKLVSKRIDTFKFTKIAL